MPADINLESISPIIHVPDPTEQFAVFSSIKGWEKIVSEFHTQRYTVKAGDVTYRVINHWTEQGLMLDRREDTKEWRKLSLLDVLWMRVLRDMRRYGIPLEKMRTAYNSIFFINNKLALWRLEWALALCLKKEPIYVVIFENGNADIATGQSLYFTDTLTNSPSSYLRINLNTLWCEIYGTYDYLPEKLQLLSLNDNEIDIIETLRSKDNDEVRIRLERGKVTSIDKTKFVQGAHKISDLLAETNFGDINIKVVKGKPVHIQQTKKVRTKK